MNRWLVALLGFLAGALVVGGIWLAFTFFSKPVTPTINNAPTTQPAAEGISFTNKKISEKKTNPLYTLTLEYPVIGGSLPKEVLEAINSDIKGKVEQTVATFRSGLEEDAEVPEDFPADSFLQGDFVSNVVFDRFVTVDFLVSEYYAGGAHPNSFAIPLNYDVQDGHLVKLEEMFEPGADYLGRLSDITRELLKSDFGIEGDDEMIDGGTEPTTENFQNFLVTDRGIEVIFQTYQVAAGAAGIQRDLVIWLELDDLLSPEIKRLSATSTL